MRQKQKILVAVGCCLFALFCLRALLLWNVMQDARQKLGIPPKASLYFRGWGAERSYQRDWLKARLLVGMPRKQIEMLLLRPDAAGGMLEPEHRVVYGYYIGYAGTALGSDIFVYVEYNPNDQATCVFFDNS